jgi:glutathione peroxidase
MVAKVKWLKKITIAIVICITVFAGYAFYISRNLNNMTARQKILKAFYPGLMWATKISGNKAGILKNETAQPTVSFYTLQSTLSDGGIFDFSGLKGKKVLLVNTASNCGYTDQYADLEKLYQEHKARLEILAFPANDFKQQEKGDDTTIAQFCKKNYGVTFPLMAKSTVIKSVKQNAVFAWLTNAASNGWNSKAPVWNFSKYIVNSKGQLTHYFDPGVSPLSKEIIEAITEN